MEFISILNAKYLEDYKIQLDFNDGKTQIIDFHDFLKSSNHPEVKKYLDLNLFKNFKIIDGDIDWNDFDLTFPIDDLYENHILKKISEKDQVAS